MKQPKERHPPLAQYRGTLTADARHALEKLVSVGKAAARQRPPGRMLFLADPADGQAYRDDQSVRALGTSLRRGARSRHRCVTEGLAAALPPTPPPARPDKSKLQGDLEQPCMRCAGREPPEGRAPGTFPWLADARVVWGLVESLRTETGRQA